MNLPNQLVPLDEKNSEEFLTMCGRAILQASNVETLERKKDVFCFRWYRGDLREEDYEYLTKEGDFQYPALVRNIPLLKPRFDLLKSEEYLRPFIWDLYLCDRYSITSKMNEIMDQVTNMLMVKAQQKIAQYASAYSQLQQMKSQAEQMNEQGAMMPPDFKEQIMSQERVLRDNQAMSEEEYESLVTAATMGNKKNIELQVKRAVTKAYEKQEMKRKFNEGFETEMITDKEIYFIDCPPHMKEPTLKLVNPLSFWWSRDEVDWIDQCEWAAFEEYMTPTGFTDRFRNIKRKKLEEIFASRGYSLDSSLGRAGAASHFYDEEGYAYHYDSDFHYSNKIPIQYMFWQSQSEVFFYTYVDESGELKEDMVMNRSEIPEGAEYEIRYHNYVYYAVFANRRFFVEGGPWEHQYHSSEFVSSGLPFIGPNKWGTTKSNSLVWDTKDIQELWNLMHYFLELWFALSGVKGVIMDESQVPEGMSKEEWAYDRKRGIGWIETLKKGRQPTYNQFKTYDDTVSPAVQHLIGIFQHFENLASITTGISRNRLGQVAGTDQVGTVKESIAQSNLTTEIRHVKHEMTKRRVLQKYTGYACKKWNTEGYQGSIVNENDLSQTLFNIQKGSLDGLDFDAYVLNGQKEEQKKQKLEQLATQSYAKQEFSTDQLVKIISMDDIREVEAALTKYAQIAEEKLIAAQNNQAMSEERIKQAEAQLKQFELQQKEKIEMMKLQVEKEKIKAEIAQREKELAFEKVKHNDEMGMKKYEVDSEKSTESLYLKKETQEMKLNAELEALRISLDGVNSKIQSLSTGNQKERVKD